MKQDGLSVRSLIKNTPPYIKNNAEGVIVKSLKKLKTKGGSKAIKAVCVDGTHPNGQARYHEVLIVGKDKSGSALSTKNSKVMVSCDCEWHCFYCEYALTQYGASKIIFSNGDKPVMTNKSCIPMVCKHTVAVLRTILEHNL